MNGAELIDLLVAVGQASPESGAPVVQAAAGGGGEQRWTISLASAAKKPPDGFEPVLITDYEQLLKFEVIRLKSWKGDYLHRPDSPVGVTTWGATIGSEWTVEALIP